MSKAEEAALKVYPVKDYNKEPNYIHTCDTKMLDEVYREVFKLGYMQAEQDLADAFQAEYAKELARADLALTIEDIELLHTFLYAIKNNKHGCFTFTRLSNEQYEEVLRRFRETKDK